MHSLPIVPALDIREQVALGLVPGGVGPVVHQLGLQRVEEAFHRRVVQRVGPPAHGRGDACAVQRRLVVTASVLDAPVRVMYQPSAGPLALGGHQQRRGRQLGAQVVAHGPAHDFARVQVHDGGHVEPALASGDVGQVCQPDLVRPASGGEPALQQVGGNREGDYVVDKHAGHG